MKTRYLNKFTAPLLIAATLLGGCSSDAPENQIAPNIAQVYKKVDANFTADIPDAMRKGAFQINDAYIEIPDNFSVMIDCGNKLHNLNRRGETNSLRSVNDYAYLSPMFLYEGNFYIHRDLMGNASKNETIHHLRMCLTAAREKLSQEKEIEEIKTDNLASWKD